MSEMNLFEETPEEIAELAELKGEEAQEEPEAEVVVARQVLGLTELAGESLGLLCGCERGRRIADPEMDPGHEVVSKGHELGRAVLLGDPRTARKRLERLRQAAEALESPAALKLQYAVGVAALEPLLLGDVAREAGEEATADGLARLGEEAGAPTRGARVTTASRPRAA